MTAPHRRLTGTRRYARSPLRLQRGLTLVELMVALALGLLLITAVGAVYVSNNRTYLAAQDGARIQEAGRYALDLIGRNLRQAGYKDIVFNAAASIPAFAGTPIRNVSTTCPSAFTIQYQGIVGEQDCQAQNVLVGAGSGQIVQHTFFIGVDATTSVPSLRCDAVRADTPPTPPSTCRAADAGVPLLDNVEDLQILYGVDTGEDQSADTYRATPSDWTKVVAARVCVLIRSENVNAAPAGQTYFNCAGALGTAASDAERFTAATDKRQRRAFVATFALRNRLTGIPGS